MANDTCAWDGCARAAVCRGFCDKHYRQARREGLAVDRRGVCADCGAEFQAGQVGRIASKCPECRHSKARDVCLSCNAPIPRVDRGPGSGLGPASHYCSEACKPRCSVEGCDRPRRKMGWCANHYTTWRTHGDPERTPAYTWAQEQRCIVCGATPDDPQWEGRFRRYCSRNCAQLFRKYQGHVPASVPCGQCGVDVPLVVPVGARQRRRSDTSFCASCIRHARTGFTAAQIAEESGAWCRLCGDDIDMTLKSPHRKSATVDHIVPRALGGSDDRTNLQLACRSCNSSKRHRYVG